MNSPEDALLGFVGQIYDAALEPQLWGQVLDGLRQMLNGASACLLTVDVHPDQGGLLEASNIDRAAFIPDLERFHRHNPFIQGWEELGAPSGRVFRGLELLSSPERVEAARKSDFYTKWAVPNGLTRVLASIVYERQPFLSPKTNVNVFRPLASPAFEPHLVHLMAQLMPHLQRSLLLHWRLTWMEKRQRAAQEVLDRIALGVLLLDESGRVTMINRAADELARRGQGLVVRQGRLAATLPEEAEPLRTRVARAIATGAGKDTYPGGTIRLHGQDDRPGLLLLATPLRTQRVDARWLGPNVCAAVFVSEPGARHPLSVDLVREWFGLTPAEARVAVDLMNGLSMGEISDRLRVSKETVRVQAKAVYGKTGVKGKTELAKVLLTSPAAMLQRS